MRTLELLEVFVSGGARARELLVLLLPINQQRSALLLLQKGGRAGVGEQSIPKTDNTDSQTQVGQHVQKRVNILEQACKLASASEPTKQASKHAHARSRVCVSCARSHVPFP